MENLPIDSETINKSLDIIDDSTKETRKEIDKTAAKGVNKLAQLFWASPIGRKADIYIAERPYKMRKELEKMKAKYDNIPSEYQVEPSSYIALKGVNELNYALEEEHLKEMFENILISDMDSRKKSRVLPSYIEIIKQLSKDDAEFLKFLYKNNLRVPSIILHISQNNSQGYFDLDSYIIYNYHKNTNNIISYSTKKLNKLVIDTLLMHRLIENTYDTFYPNEAEKYETLFNAVSKNYNLDSNTTLSYDKGLVRLTELGKNFIEICLS